MCLTSKRKRLIFARKRIECYKVILEWRRFADLDNPEFRMYETPYMRKFIDRDCILGNKPFKAKEKVYKKKNKEYKEYCYHRGLIHVYQTLEGVRRNFPFKYFTKEDIAVYKCYIMPGTRYVDGEDMVNEKCYAAKKIVFGEKVDFQVLNS